MIKYATQEQHTGSVTVAFHTNNPQSYDDILGKYYHDSGLGWNKANGGIRDMYESEEKWKEQLERESLLFLGIKKES